MPKTTSMVNAQLLEQTNKTKARCDFDVTDNQKRYQEAWRYYSGELPEPFDLNMAPNAGRASRAGYVENVVMETVNKLTASILPIFTENDSEAVVFRSKGFKRDPFIDQMINTEINQIFLRQNDGYYHLENAIKEAVLSGNGFMKVFVEEYPHSDKMPLDGWHKLEDVIAGLADNPDPDGSQWHLDLPSDFNETKKGKWKGMQWRETKTKILPEPLQGISDAAIINKEITGIANISKVVKKVIVEQVEPMTLIFDTNCGSDFDKCRYICHKKEITVGDAINMGFTEDNLRDASMDTELIEAPLSKRNLLTTGQFDSIYGADDYSSDPYERRVTLNEHYIYSSIPTGKTKLYKVTATQNEILDYKEIPAMPFVNMRSNIIPGSFWGYGVFDICKHYQDMLSNFARVASQKAMKAAFPSYQAVKGSYDREALLQLHRPGAIVEVTAIGAVTPVLEPQVPTEALNMMQYLTNSLDKKVSTSVGALAGADGSMPENVSSQSIAMMVSNEGMKDKIYAKAIARSGIRPLFEKLYELIKAEGIIIHTTQGDITADKLPYLYEFEIDVNTAGDKAIQARTLGAAVQTIAQLGQIQSPIITPSNMVAIAGALLDGSDLDPSMFFTDPTANVTPEQMQEQQMNEDLDKSLAMEGKKLAYQSALAEYNLTLAKIAKMEAETDEQVKTHHAERESRLNDSLLMAQNHQLKAATEAANVSNDSVNTGLKRKAIDAEIILKTAELHQKGSTETDVNGVRV